MVSRHLQDGYPIPKNVPREVFHHLYCPKSPCDKKSRQYVKHILVQYTCSYIYIYLALSTQYRALRTAYLIHSTQCMKHNYRYDQFREDYTYRCISLPHRPYFRATGVKGYMEHLGKLISIDSKIAS